MKKKNLWMLATGALLAVGLISCTKTRILDVFSIPERPTAAYRTIAQNPWQITSVVFKKSDQITDSLNYTSADSLSSSRIIFGSNSIYQFSDKNNAAWVGPKNDSTLFRYGNGTWYLDAYYVTKDSLSAVPDSLLFVAYDFNNDFSVGTPLFRSKINGLDSLHLQITYLDSSIMNTTTHTKYSIRKVVSFIPVSN